MTKRINAAEVKAEVAAFKMPAMKLVRFRPDTKYNQRVRDENLDWKYQHAHAVVIEGIQRAVWKKRAGNGWDLADIDGVVIKTTRLHHYTGPGGVPKQREVEATVYIVNSYQMNEATQRAIADGLIPTPADMKALRMSRIAAINRSKLDQYKLETLNAKQDAASALFAALSNIVAMETAGGAACRGLAQAALAKVKLPAKPDLKKDHGDDAGTWLLSADRLYDVKGKKK